MDLADLKTHRLAGAIPDYDAEPQKHWTIQSWAKAQEIVCDGCGKPPRDHFWTTRLFSRFMILRCPVKPERRWITTGERSSRRWAALVPLLNAAQMLGKVHGGRP